MSVLLREASYVPRYILVGLMTLGVDVGTFSLMRWIVGESHHLLALTSAVVCAYVVNFLGHKFITFSVIGDGARQLAFHLPMKTGVYCARFMLMYVLVDWYGHAVTSTYALGLCFGVVTFLGSRWIFTRSNPLELALMIRLGVSIVCEKIKVRLHR